MLTFNEDISNNLKVVGDLIVVKTSEIDGAKEEYHHKNLVVTAGKSVIVARLAGNTAAVMSHMAVGTGNTSPVVSNTTLETELARVSLTVAGGTPASNTISYSASYPAGTGTGALAEAGIFNDATTGSMLCRTVFPVINKSASDAITVTWTISIV